MILSPGIQPSYKLFCTIEQYLKRKQRKLDLKWINKLTLFLSKKYDKADSNFVIEESEKATVFSYHSSTPPTVKDWFLFFSAFIFISLYFYISVRKINYFKSTLTVCLGRVNHTIQ